LRRAARRISVAQRFDMDVFLIPRGFDTRHTLHNRWLYVHPRCRRARWLTGVCTGF
jgi:hypothetical protein